MPRCLDGTTLQRLQSSIAPCYLHVATPVRASIAPCRYTCSEPPELHISMLPHRYTPTPISRPQTSLSRCRSSRRKPQYLHASTSLRLQRVSRAPALHTFVPPRLHVCSAPPGLHASPSPCLQRASRPLYFSISLHIQRASRAPCLHVATPGASQD